MKLSVSKSNLGLDEEDIYKVFVKYGHVLDVIVPSENKSIAYILFGDIETALFVIKHLDGFILEDSVI